MKTKWMVAGVMAATLLLGACGDDDLGVGSDDGGGADRLAAATSAAGNAEKPAASGETTSGADSSPLPAIDPSRKIIFTASMALNAADVGRTFTDASGLAKSNGGYVEKSAFSNDTLDSTRRSASLTIRVPVANYDSLVASLRTLSGATVSSEGSNSNEVTGQYIDLQSNQRNLERTEEQYLELLKQAKTIQEVLTVQDRLTSVRGQIEQIQGRLKVLDGQTEFATVNLTISPVAASVKDTSDSHWTLGGVLVESLHRSVETARYVAAAAIVGTVALAWLAVPLALALFAVARLRKREPAAIVPPVTPLEG
ncbi:MAG: DUF4349 domain-containing protein [bacterium]